MLDLLLWIVALFGATAEVPTCSAWLFMDGELGGAMSFPLKVGLGNHLLDDLIRASQHAEQWWNGFGQLPGGVVGSADVFGSSRCFLTFFEHPTFSGWSVTIGPGRFPKCVLRSYGVPPAVPGALRLESEPPGTLGRGIAFVPRKGLEAGEAVSKGLVWFRFFQLNFQMEAASTTPIMEMLTTGFTFKDAFFDKTLADALGFPIDQNPILSLWMIKTGETCELMLRLLISGFPKYPEWQDCSGAFICSPHFFVSLSLATDMTIRGSVNNLEVMACRVRSTLDAQQDVELYLGSHLQPVGTGTRISDIHYQLLGPLGPFTGPSPTVHRNGTSPQPIPATIHQVWFGRGEPQQLIDSWRSYALRSGGDFEHRLWRSDSEVHEALREFQEDPLLKESLKLREAAGNGKSDLLRTALLYALGGLYTDADSFWLGRRFLTELQEPVTEFMAGWISKHQPLLNGAVMASTPRGQVVRWKLEMQIQLFQHCRVDLEIPTYNSLGPGLLTYVLSLDGFRKSQMAQLRNYTTFYPKLHAEDPWKNLGIDLPSLAQVPGAVSVDLGLSTNKYSPQNFGHLLRSKKELELLQAWISAMEDTLNELRITRRKRKKVRGAESLMVVSSDLLHVLDGLPFGQASWVTVLVIGPDTDPLWRLRASYPSLKVHSAQRSDFKSLADVLKDDRWQSVVTHGPQDEIEIHLLVRALADLYTVPFGVNWKSAVHPGPSASDFNVSKTLLVDTEISPAMLRLQVIAFALKSLAEQISSFAKVGLLEMPKLQRFLLQRALGNGVGNACTFASADALLWLAIRRKHAALLLPAPILDQKVMEDPTAEVVKRHFPRLRSIGERFRPSKDLEFCEVFIGRCELLLDLAVSPSALICCYGRSQLGVNNTDTVEFATSIEALWSKSWNLQKPLDCVSEPLTSWYGCCFHSKVRSQVAQLRGWTVLMCSLILGVQAIGAS